MKHSISTLVARELRHGNKVKVAKGVGDVIEGDIECAVEDFLEAGDFSAPAQKKFLERQARAIKVDHPHTDPRAIDQALQACLERLLAESLEDLQP